MGMQVVPKTSVTLLSFCFRVKVNWAEEIELAYRVSERFNKIPTEPGYFVYDIVSERHLSQEKCG